MTRKWLWALGIPVLVILVASRANTAARWLGPAKALGTTGGIATEFPRPNSGSAPTTIALTQDGAVWFTESAGNRIGRMGRDGTGLAEFPLPNPNSTRGGLLGLAAGSGSPPPARTSSRTFSSSS